MATERGSYKIGAVGKDKALTPEIIGTRMHRVSDVDHWTNSLLKVTHAGVRRGNMVLDTCMGLGYTASAPQSRGASRVLTFEVDEDVPRFAEQKPRIRAFSDKKVEMRLEDVVEAIKSLQSNSFDKTIHRPPRLTEDYGDPY